MFTVKERIAGAVFLVVVVVLSITMLGPRVKAQWERDVAAQHAAEVRE